VIARPKPLLAPVMSHTLLIGFLPVRSFVVTSTLPAVRWHVQDLM
jgi:hypothetical protein